MESVAEGSHDIPMIRWFLYKLGVWWIHMDAPGHHRYWQLAEPCHAFSAWAARSQASYGHRHPPGTKGSKEGHVQLLGVIEWKIMENLQDFMVSTHFYIVFLTHKSWSVGSFPLSFACSKFGSPKLDFEHQNKDSNQSMYVYYIISFFFIFLLFLYKWWFHTQSRFQPTITNLGCHKVQTLRCWHIPFPNIAVSNQTVAGLKIWMIWNPKETTKNEPWSTTIDFHIGPLQGWVNTILHISSLSFQHGQHHETA